VEAGGHVQSTTPLWELLPQLVALAGETPVIAAGGIGNGAGIARALEMGAAGAMLGTRFVATQESRAHPDYKRRIVAATASDAALTVCFDGGWTYAAHRALRNSTLEGWEAQGCPPHGRRPGEGDVIASTESGEPIFRYEDTAPRLGMTGEIEAMCQYAGTSCAFVQDIPSASELVPRLWAERLAAHSG
jgi:NAD(P)H-dependent flavin oxidoreductase YrpB (nitropropane dioxygenase family)